MNAIVAVSQSWGIGKENNLLFSIPEDMKFFRTMTSGKTVIMGRKTLESMPGGKPLKNRRNIIISTRKDAFDADVEVVSSPVKAYELVKDVPPDDVFVIGGGEVYRAMLPFCQKAYITKVAQNPDADKFFPDVDRLMEWHLTQQSEVHEYNGIVYTFCVYKNDSISCQINEKSCSVFSPKG